MAESESPIGYSFEQSQELACQHAFHLSRLPATGRGDSAGRVSLLGERNVPAAGKVHAPGMLLATTMDQAPG